MAQSTSPQEDAREEAFDTFLMADLFPPDTGLSMTVWVSERGDAADEACLVVNERHGARADLDHVALVTVDPDPRLVRGELSSRDLRAVSDWIALNREVILNYWNSRTDAFDLARRLKPLPG